MNNLAVRKCDVTPDISLMKKMASISGTIPSRIMELVDNSIDARIEGKVLKVDVNIVKRGRGMYIEVVDNGCGMTETVAKTYFQLGKTQKLGQKKIGRFGLGSKVAIIGLGDKCKLETTPIDVPYSVEINFDIHRFKDWKIDYNVKEDEVNNHGTRIRIEHLSVRLGNVARMCERLQEHFAKTYKHFIEKGMVELKINGQEVVPMTVDLIPELYQEFDFKVNGKRVYGWASAMKKAGTNWKFGFDLINNGRIIKSNDLLSRQAHTSLARLTGEIHLDDFKTDIHKTEFLRDDPDFQLMQERLLNKQIADLLNKIARLTNREVFNKYSDDMQEVSKMLNKVIKSYDFLDNIDIEDGVFKKLKKKAEKNKDLKEKRKKKELEQNNQELEEQDLFDEIDNLFSEMEKEEKKEKREYNRKKDAGLIIREPVGVSLGEEQPAKRWIVDEQNDGLYLNVEVNLEHPTYQKEEDENIAVHMKNAVLDSLAEFILQEEKKHVGMFEDEIDRFNRIKDMVVRHSMKV